MSRLQSQSPNFFNSKELLITNLLTLENFSLSLKKIDKIIPNRWNRMKTPVHNKAFPSAFVSCDEIYSNSNKKTNNKTNTLYVENAPTDEIVRNAFSKYSGYLGIKSSEHFGKKLCFITFDSVKNAEYASTDCFVKSTFAKNSTRNYS